MRKTFYNSWFSLIVFVGLIIFVPYKVSYFSFKASDVWLWMCLALQYLHGYYLKADFRNRLFIKTLGLWMGVIAILGTLFQAWHDGTRFEPEFISEFYRFFRYFLIFKLVENVVVNSTRWDVKKFFYAYTAMGGIVVVLSFLEFYAVGPFKDIVLSFYYIVPDQTFDEYFEEFGRLLGVMGNSNATGIYMTSTLVFPFFFLILKRESLLMRLVLVSYVLLALIVIVFMTASRTSIIISILLFLFVVLLSFAQVKNFVRFIVFMIIGILLGVFLYSEYGAEITLADRVTYFFEGRSTSGEKVGFIESLGRNELWLNRVHTFEHHANPVAAVTGMGYTHVYKEYSDNGLLSSFFNGGMAGLILRCALYFLVFKYCVWDAFKRYKRVSADAFPLITGVISFAFILWELTADLVEHVKLGQLFYLTFSFSVIYVARFYGRGKKQAPGHIRNTTAHEHLVNGKYSY